eukprot:11196284-Lingulodinium_polyedra.AAC.1
MDFCQAATTTANIPSPGKRYPGSQSAPTKGWMAGQGDVKDYFMSGSLQLVAESAAGLMDSEVE